MAVRLATLADLAYVIERATSIGQRYSEERVRELVTDARYITTVDRPTGLFWAELVTPTLVLAGISVAADDVQIKALYKAALVEAGTRWPQATTLEARLRVDWCKPQVVPWVTAIAKMPLVSTEADGTRVYRMAWRDLLKALR